MLSTFMVKDCVGMIQPRELTKTSFAVIPSSHITTLKNRGIIKGQDSLSISISILDKGKRYLLNNKDDISTFINNFGQIK